MFRAVIDCNAVDHLPPYYERVRSALDNRRLDLLWTHVTVDELSVIPDPDRRAMLMCLAASTCRFVPTGAFVVGFSRLDMARLTKDVDAFQAYRAGNIRHTRDALVAITAVVEQAAVVSYDGGMRRRAAAQDLAVVDWPGVLTASES